MKAGVELVAFGYLKKQRLRMGAAILVLAMPIAPHTSPNRGPTGGL